MTLVILDRDGVINEDSEKYIRSLSEWRPIAGSLDAIADLSRAGFCIAVATNQSGLARGYFSREDMDAIHDRLRQLVAARGGQISGIFHCPHHPAAGCRCRKPATGLLRAIEKKLGESAAGAPFIGDSLKDLQAAQAFGCRAILVRTGNGEATLAALQAGEAHLPRPQQVAVYDDLAAAARAILSTI
jgi:D-glycero-D-manno-heptose 1,7-bisphosphate phosphatase